MAAEPRRVKELFVAALELHDPHDRRALLDRECGGDADLRRRIDALLAAHDHPESALERPLAAPAITADHTPAADVGTVIAGRYKLLEPIGEGGMGEVWVADQLEPIRRRVALKVIKPGMDSRAVLARFEAERQALALMDHPNIARVLDAGTTDDGRPFFVMELVKGTPITAFCDARKLSARERLELFVPVCQAIQHAHQKGVIHRDIKPTNVLVELYDDRAVPKVIDFGVAKAIGQRLTEMTLYTGFGSLVGTPAYMAPEQATFNALDVDTRADVYALGVLLYELLAGSPPFEPERLRQAALDEVLRLVREEEPPRPSHRLSTSQAKATIAAVRRSDPAKLAKLFRGELDWIVMKALEKDRTRRYDSATGLAKDVERYLNDEPVEACPPTLGYRVRKAFRKHRAAVWVAGAFALVLLAAAGVSVAFGVLAKRAEADAIAARNAEAEQRGETEVQRDAAIKAGKETARQRDETNAALGKLRDAQERQRDDQYVWDMQLLPLAFEANNVAEVKRVLDRHVPQPGQTDRRGFEWRYWDRQLHTDLRTDRLPDAGGSRGLTVWVASPDGSRVARFTTPAGGGGEAEDPPTLVVWDVASRQLVLKHRMPIEKPVNQSYSSPPRKAPVFSRDGKRVVVEWGFTVPAPMQALGRQLRQVLDVATGKVLLNLEGDLGQGASGIGSRGQVEGAFSPDGRRFAAVCHESKKATFPVIFGQVRVWDLESGKEVCAPLDANALADPPFNKDGTRLVTQNRQQRVTRVSVWDLASGEEKTGWDVPDAELVGLAFSPDGARVAGATANLFRTVRPRGEPPPPEPQVKVWDATGKELYTLSPPGPDRRTMARRVYFSPDGARLVVERSTNLPPTIGTAADLTVWDAATGKPLASPAGLEIRDPGFSHEIVPAFSPDGKQFVHAEGNVLRTWDVETGRPVLTLRGHVNTIATRAFTADGKRLWSVEFDGLLKEWDALPARVEIGVVAPRPPAGAGANSSPMFALAVSPDGSRVASLIAVRNDLKVTAPWFPAVRVWEANGKPVQILQPPPRDTDGPRRPDYALALSRDGRRAVLTRHETGFAFGKGKEDAPPPDLTAWDVESKTMLLHRQLEWGHAPRVAISPDGKTVAVASKAAGERATIRLFDLDGKRERTPLTAGDAGGISSLTFSPDSRRLAAFCSSVDTAAHKQSARIGVWDVESGTQLCAVEMFGNRPTGAGITTAIRIAWAPDGSRFVFSPDTGRNSEIAVYDITGKKVLTLEEPATAAGTSGVQYVAYSPDGKRIAALQLGRTFGAVPALKMWDAVSGKELLSLRPKTLETLGDKSLTFTGDGHRLQLTELVGERRPPELGGGETSVRSLLLTSWDATPVTEREPKKP